jgi:RNA polymerase sigma-70 factor (ECF subfamily)
VASAITGDEQAYTALYRRHAPYIARLIYRILGSDSDLDDILQETFVDGFRQLEALTEHHKIRSYLVTIAVRRIHARLSFRYRVRKLGQQLLGTSPRVSDPELRATVHALYAALGRVDPRHRIAWVLHRVEGYTLPEVAQQTTASLATVKRWVAAVDQVVEDSNVTR